MRSMMGSLHRWKTTHFPSVPRKLEKMRKELDGLAQLNDEASESRRRELFTEMDELLYREELMWLQRSRVDWLRAGDRNTKYFHRKAARCQQKNKIRKLKRPDGTVTKNTKEMEESATNFFQNLYTRDEEVEPSIITDLLQPCVDDRMNVALIAPFSEREIGDALF
jgi:hypothetical protein